MENLEKRKISKSILIPVFDICQIPPLDKVIKLANKANLRVHIAGFISSQNDTSNLMEQTIRLTRILKVILHRLNGKVRSVSSKIYATTQSTKVKNLVKEEGVKVIITQKLDEKLLSVKSVNNNLILLQLSKPRKNNSSETLFVCTGSNKKINEVKEILEILDNTIEYIHDEPVDTISMDTTISNLKSKVTFEQITDWMDQHNGGCIALHRDDLRKEESLKILDQESTSILIY